MFILADADPLTFGNVAFVLMAIVACGCTIVGAIVSVLAYTKKAKPSPETDYVTRGELMREIDRLAAELKESREYTRTFNHATANRLHVVNIRIVFMMGLLTQLCHAQNPPIPVPPEPSISPKDEV